MHGGGGVLGFGSVATAGRTGRYAASLDGGCQYDEKGRCVVSLEERNERQKERKKLKANKGCSEKGMLTSKQEGMAEQYSGGQDKLLGSMVSFVVHTSK